VRGEIQPIPAVQINRLPSAIDTFQQDAARSPPFVQNHANLLQLANDIVVPVTGHGMM
jgi:hypothetical protein